MADLELYFDPSETGKTVTADLILNGAVNVAGHSFVEQAAAGVYFADAPAGLGAGVYIIRPYLDGVAQVPFAFDWDGAGEVKRLEDLHDFAGLNPAAPLTITPTQKAVNGKTAGISGDGVTTATQTRTT